MLETALSIGAPAAQPPVPPADGLSSVVSVASGALGAFVTTLAVGAVLVALAPAYTDARMSDVLEEPFETFLYGLACLVVLALAIVVLVITLIGIVVAVPLAVLAYLAWAAGAAIGFLAIGERLVGREDGWAKPLFVGAALNGALTLTGIGGIVAFAVGAAGFGAVLRRYLG